MSGFITLHRSLLEWEWYNDVNVKTLFIHCLLKANWEDKNWQGNLIKRGSFVTSVSMLSQELKLTNQKVRTVLEKLKKTNEIFVKTTNKFTVITIVKYSDYQDFENKNNNQITNEQQSNNNQITTTNNNNNITIEQDLNVGQENLPNPKITFEKIDFKKLTEFLNKATGRNLHEPNQTVKNKYIARLKEGIPKSKITDAIINACEDPYHIETNFKYLTMEFFSRADKIELHGSKKINEPIKFKSNVK